MNQQPAIRIWRLAAGWALSPAVFLLVGFFISGLTLNSSIPVKIVHNSGQGMVIGLAAGVCLAGFYTSMAIHEFLPLSGLQMSLITGGWVLALSAGGLTGMVVNKFSSMLPRSWFMDMYPIVIYIALALTCGLSIGAVGGFVTTEVIRRNMPELSIKSLGGMILRWWIGFTVGGLLGGPMIIYGLIAYYLIGDRTKPEMALAFAAGAIIVGLSGALTGGRFMLQQLAEFT
jgi:hypothetical protein